MAEIIFFSPVGILGFIAKAEFYKTGNALHLHWYLEQQCRITFICIPQLLQTRARQPTSEKVGSD